MPQGDPDIDDDRAEARNVLVRRAGVVGAGTLFSRILGLLRDVVLAAVFGKEDTDAFFVAFTIPNALRQLLAEGAVSSAVVPLLAAKVEKEGDDAGRAFFAKVRGVSLVVLAVVTVLGILAAEPLTSLFAGGYRDRPELFERTVTLTRTLFPYIFFMGTAALGMAALNVGKRFVVAAFAPSLLNVGLIGGAVLLPAMLASSGTAVVQALAFGALVGGALQVLAQVPSLRAIGYASRPRFDLADPDVRAVFRRIAPMTIGIGIYYVDLVLSRRFLSELGTGAQSYFAWASHICEFPQGVFVMALSTAALPSLAALVAKGDDEELGRVFSQGMRLSLFVAIPASVALVVLSEPLVVAFLQRGRFDAVASSETARALVFQGAGVFAVASVRQLVAMFYAVGDTVTPVVVSGIDLVVFVVLALALKGSLGHAGVSIAITGSSVAQMILLAVALRRKRGSLRGREIAASALRTTGASAVAAFGAFHAARIATVGSGPFLRLLPAAVGGVTFVALFLATGWGLRSPELDALVAAVSRRLGRRRVASG
ncbi:MAG: murein biosynthesis integral membrane protein MurJ [Polyangiaceae bacterium]